MVALSLRDDAVVAREARRLLRDHAEAGRVMVAPGDQRRARRRAQGRGVELRVAQARLAMRSRAGVGMTPPKVLGAPKPTSSVMISRTLGAPLGGTTRGGHQGFDCAALPSILPPNFGGGGGSCSAVDGRGGAGRAGHAAQLAGPGRARPPSSPQSPLHRAGFVWLVSWIRLLVCLWPTRGVFVEATAHRPCRPRLECPSSLCLLHARRHRSAAKKSRLRPLLPQAEERRPPRTDERPEVARRNALPVLF